MAGSKSQSPDRPRDNNKDDKAEGKKNSSSISKGKRYSSSRSNSRRRGGNNRPNRSSSPGGDRSNTGNVLYCGNLNKSVQENEMRELFEKYGKITSINVVKDPFTSECRGFAFVNFQSSEQALEACNALNGTKLHHREMKIEVAKRGQGHEKTPGQYKGHYRSKHNKDRRSISPYGRKRYRSRSGGRRSSRDRGYSGRGYHRERSYSGDRRSRDRSKGRYRGRENRSRSRDRYRSSSRNRRR